MREFAKLTISILCLGTLLFPSQQALAEQWRPVRGGILYGISGMALIEQKNSLDFLIVHDNKQANQGRLAIIRIIGRNQPEYLPVQWPSNLEFPIDLEALTDVPGTNKTEFIALTSAGKAYHLKLNSINKSISVLKVFDVPEGSKSDNFEAFSLQNIDGKLIAIWAHRGGGTEAAKIYWGGFDINKHQINLAGTADFKVPFPGENVRHISDIKIDSAGIVYLSAASDTGDNGPFQSAIYVAGYLTFNGNKIVWRQTPQLFPIYRDNYHKIEALEIIPGEKGGLIVGTDDENIGSFLDIINEN
ncbi:MAG TPA: hypothetical protein VK184_00725 [Nostocaceae cyanobacterium]|nr:hypothetical protein [Nostocaceae cyanobacterium]